MTTNIAAHLVSVLPAMAVLSAGTTRTARKGRRVRLYSPCASVPVTGETLAAVTTLVRAGHQVRVYEGSTIYTASWVDGELVWATRATCRNRETATVEVVL